MLCCLLVVGFLLVVACGDDEVVGPAQELVGSIRILGQLRFGKYYGHANV